MAIIVPRIKSRMRFDAGRPWIEASEAGVVFVSAFFSRTEVARVGELVNMIVVSLRKFASFVALPDL
jgi:hypothetical protein